MKPLIVGMNNPQGNHPLFPYPKNCAGYRLWKMINDVSPQYFSRKKYLESFDRINIVENRQWCGAAARARADAVRAKMEGHTAVLCGRAVAAALGLPRTSWMVWNRPMIIRGGDAVVDEKTRWCVIPHPSGLTREYNNLRMREDVGKLLFELYSAQVGAAA